LRDTGNEIDAIGFSTNMKHRCLFSSLCVRDITVLSKLDLFSQLVGKRQLGLQKLLVVILYFQEAAYQGKEKPRCKYFW